VRAAATGQPLGSTHAGTATEATLLEPPLPGTPPPAAAAAAATARAMAPLLLALHPPLVFEVRPPEAERTHDACTTDDVCMNA
jgi:hypothetical protein